MMHRKEHIEPPDLILHYSCSLCECHRWIALQFVMQRSLMEKNSRIMDIRTIAAHKHKCSKSTQHNHS